MPKVKADSIGVEEEITKVLKMQRLALPDILKGFAVFLIIPVHILELDNTTTNAKGYTPLMTTDPEKCIGCGFCAIMCPDSVITVEKFIKEVN